VTISDPAKFAALSLLMNSGIPKHLIKTDSKIEAIFALLSDFNGIGILNPLKRSTIFRYESHPLGFGKAFTMSI
jgi:hypothetical protein